MSEVDLKTNESELISARDQVLNDLEAETSALFAYEDAGQSNTLKVEMVENMGISDLLLEFNSGRYLQDDHLERRESRGLLCNLKMHFWSCLRALINHKFGTFCYLHQSS